ncbi:hypothetical protein [Domibacillus robiginosus]|uniref:hypothetical protein n=1 Tax=Domibacillus robiginosus TaxID=1071054 RepID=UPI00067D8726|nr:hypothetical protein [Domibacillus robiginosus]
MITSLHERELRAVLDGFVDYIEEQADPDRLERLHHTWIPLLSTYVTHDAVESVLDEWHAMIENPFLWIHYIEEQLALTAKPIIQNTLEKWKKPFVFAGHQLSDELYACWSDGRKRRTASACSAAHIIGLALPMEENAVLLLHYFNTDEAFEGLLEAAFSKTTNMTRQRYLNDHYLTCLSLQSDNS